MTADGVVRQLRVIQQRHSPVTTLWDDGPRQVCAYCKNIVGMRYVPWPCPDRQNADKGLKETQ